MKIGIAHKTVAEVRSFTTQDVRLNPKVYITNSGKEGEFVYDSTDTTTADNLGTVLVSGSARYKRVFDVVVRPEWFGAVGDNSTYDTTAFQNTFAFASASGYDVELYKKTYKVSTLTVPDNITIIGNKATLNQVRTSGTAVPVLILGSNNKVSYLNIICDPVASPDQNSGGIYAGNKSNIDISNCYVKNHGVFGIHINGCKNVNVLKNKLWTNHQLSTLLVYGGWEQTTDIYIYSPSNGVSEKILVEGNRCNSPFTSQGIWANGEGNDREIVITNNFCITTNEDGTDWANTNFFFDAGNGMIRRHGIQFGYQGFSGCGSAIISNNICRRTLVTGIYIAGQGIGKGVVVANNHCIENGYTTNTDDFLAGGIDIGAGLGNILVTGNQIVDFKCASFAAGGINIQRNTSVANNHNVTLADNAVINSAGQGYRILSGADRVIINGGSITNSALIDIYYNNSPATLDNWLTISNLSILRNNIANRSIWIDTYYPKKIELSNITIKGIDSVTDDTLNCAIFINNPNNPLLIRNCTIDNFFYGIYYNNAVIGRKKDLVVSDNYFKNTQIAIFAEAYFPNQAFIVGHNNRFDNVTLFQYQNNYRCYYEGEYRTNDNISIYVPNINVATGSWKQGDRLITEAPIQGDAETNICTISGTFGTLSGVTGGITSGTKTLVVNVATDLSVDMYINIVGVTGTKRITSVSGTTITIDTNANATVSGAAISYQTPSFIKSVNLSTSTFATLTGSEALTNKSVNGVTLNTGGSASLFLNQQGSYVADEVLISLAANQTSNVVTYADVTGFVVPVVAGKTYKIEILAMFSSNTTTTGISFGVYSATAAGTIGGFFAASLAATAVATGLKIPISTLTTTPQPTSSITSTGVTVINVKNYIEANIIFNCTTSGNIQFAMASEVAATIVTLHSGSALIYKQWG